MAKRHARHIPTANKPPPHPATTHGDRRGREAPRGWVDHVSPESRDDSGPWTTGSRVVRVLSRHNGPCERGLQEGSL